MGDPAALRDGSRVPSTYTEGRQGFGPFVEERNDRVVIPESLRASLRAVASSGCERDSGADGASASSSPWIGTTESDPGVGERGIVDSSSRDETTALSDAMSTDLASAAGRRVDSTALIDAHVQGDPPRIDDTPSPVASAASKNDNLSQRSPLDTALGCSTTARGTGTTPRHSTPPERS